MARLGIGVSWEDWAWDRFDAVDVSYPDASPVPVLVVREPQRVLTVSVVGCGLSPVSLRLERHQPGASIPPAVRVLVSAPPGSRVVREVHALVEGEVDWSDALATIAKEARGAGVEPQEPTPWREPGLLAVLADVSRVRPGNERGYLHPDTPEGWEGVAARLRTLAGGRPILLEHVSGLHFVHRDLNPPFAVGTGLGPRARAFLGDLASTNAVGVVWDGALGPASGFDERPGAPVSPEQVWESVATEVEALREAGVRWIVVGKPDDPRVGIVTLERLRRSFPGMGLVVRGPVAPGLRRFADVAFEATRGRLDGAVEDAAGEEQYHALRSADVVSSAVVPQSRSLALFRYGEVRASTLSQVSTARVERDQRRLNELGYIPFVETGAVLP